jgi:hypothetical protein
MRIIIELRKDILMDYEELYQQILVLEKDLKDNLSGVQRAYRNLTKNSRSGELKSLNKDLAQTKSFLADYDNTISAYNDLLAGFDAGEYLESGDFARQLIKYCETRSVDIKGNYPVYEVFPYKVKIDSENQEIFIDRKKTQCVRPAHFVDMIKQSQDKLHKAAFNVNAFLNELAEAYDVAMLRKQSKDKSSKRAGSGSKEHESSLRDLYSIMVPMQRFRRDYDMQNFAFDLARLNNSDIEKTKDERYFEFGPSRNAKMLIRILDREGKEQFLGTIRFYK